MIAFWWLRLATQFRASSFLKLKISDKASAIFSICLTAWILCFCFYIGALFTIDKDTSNLRTQMEERAKAM
jgi:hypothetical protein